MIDLSLVDTGPLVEELSRRADLLAPAWVDALARGRLLAAAELRRLAEIDAINDVRLPSLYLRDAADRLDHGAGLPDADPVSVHRIAMGG